MIRQIGDHVLTAHAIPLNAMFFPEILVSRCGGLTLHRYQVAVTGFATYALAVEYAQQQLPKCSVASDGSLLACHTVVDDDLGTGLRDGLGRTLQRK